MKDGKREVAEIAEGPPPEPPFDDDGGMALIRGR
jgi:hypothetical protein